MTIADLKRVFLASAVLICHFFTMEAPLIRPQVVTWFKVYAGLMTLVYLLVAVMGLLLLIPGLIPADTGEDALFMKVGAVMYLGFGLVFGGAFAVALATKGQSWAWVYNLVLICLGLTSCLFLPVCVPLMIFWLKPEVKAFYGRMA